MIKPKKDKKTFNLSPEFFYWLEKVNKKYEELIKELAKK
jgi:hypothetical protein